MCDGGKTLDVFFPRLVGDELGGALPLVFVLAIADGDVAAKDDGAVGNVGPFFEGLDEPVAGIGGGCWGRSGRVLLFESLDTSLEGGEAGFELACGSFWNP